MSTDDSDDTCTRESHEDGALLGCFLRGLARGLQALGFGAPHVHDDLVEAKGGQRVDELLHRLLRGRATARCPVQGGATRGGIAHHLDLAGDDPALLDIGHEARGGVSALAFHGEADEAQPADEEGDLQAGVQEEPGLL